MPGRRSQAVYKLFVTSWAQAGPKNGDGGKESTSLAVGDSIKDQRVAYESAGEK